MMIGWIRDTTGGVLWMFIQSFGASDGTLTLGWVHQLLEYIA